MHHSNSICPDDIRYYTPFMSYPRDYKRQVADKTFHKQYLMQWDYEEKFYDFNELFSAITQYKRLHYFTLILGL